ncbi:MAG TPA: hypothetical protein PK530_11885 [Anaerolineales bacterium]|nr:hypothetical protein [Anaerolineales bacterium]
MSDPKLAEALNPRLAANRRMATEGQAIPALPDRTASAPVGRFGKKWTPEERAKQNAELARILMERR